jgi:hypothetical protein
MLVKKLLGKSALETPVINIKMDLRENSCEDGRWMVSAIMILLNNSSAFEQVGPTSFRDRKILPAQKRYQFIF